MRDLWKRWKRIGRRIGDFQARALLTFFYFVILSPFALVVRWGSDPLALKSRTQKGWRLKSDTGHSSIERATAQF